MSSQTMNKNRDSKVLVTDAYYYIPLNDPSASEFYGSKCILINQDAGVGYFGVLNPKDPFATHFAPLPKFRPEPVTVHSVNETEMKRARIYLNDFKFIVKEQLGVAFGISCLFYGSRSELLNFKKFLKVEIKESRWEDAGFTVFTFQGTLENIEETFKRITNIKHTGWHFMKRPYDRNKNVSTGYREIILQVEKVS